MVTLELALEDVINTHMLSDTEQSYHESVKILEAHVRFTVFTYPLFSFYTALLINNYRFSAIDRDWKVTSIGENFCEDVWMAGILSNGV